MIVCKDKVEKFLENLGVDIVSATVEAEEDESEEDEDGNSILHQNEIILNIQ